MAAGRLRGEVAAGRLRGIPGIVGVSTPKLLKGARRQTTGVMSSTWFRLKFHLNCFVLFRWGVWMTNGVSGSSPIEMQVSEWARERCPET